MATVMRYHGGSGVQSHVKTFQRYLDEAGRPACVVTPFSARSPLLVPIFAARLGLRHISRPTSVWWYRYWHAQFLRRSLKERLTRSGPSILYAQCPVSADVALRVRTTHPVVMAAHLNISQADEWADKGEIVRNGALFQSIQRFENRVLRELDGVVYVSSFTRARLEERIPALAGIPSIVAPNPVRMGTPSGAQPDKDLITVGALEPRKNQSYLLEILSAASRRGHRYTLSVVGDGPDLGKLKALARERGLTNQVQFLGHQADPRAFMRGHRLYCHASRMESFGIALVEAMSEGLPVLAAPVGGIPEVVRPGREGEFWPLDDAEAAADVLIDVLEDADRLAHLAISAHARARREYSTEVAGPRILSFLDNCGVRLRSNTDRR